MAVITKPQEAALKRRYRDLGRGITGENIIIATENPGGLGSTAAKPIIWLGFHHEYLKELDYAHTIVALDGTFAHEIMHRLLTKFSILKTIDNNYCGIEQRIMKTINNIMEDNYIERMASNFLGDFLIHALIYMRQIVYSKSPNIEAGTSPYSQFEIAAIQYGDGGLLKGHFTDPETEKVFYKCLPLFDKHMNEPDPNIRYQLCQEVLEITRPLWEKMSGDDIDKLMDDLSKCGRENADSNSSSSSTPIIVKKSELKKLGLTPRDAKRARTAAKGATVIIIDDEADEDVSSGGDAESDTEPDPSGPSSDSNEASSDFFDSLLSLGETDDKKNEKESAKDGETTPTDDREGESEESKPDKCENPDADKKCTEGEEVPDSALEGEDDSNKSSEISSDADHDEKSSGAEGDSNYGEEAIDESEFELSEEDLAHALSEMDEAMIAEEVEMRDDTAASDLALDYSVTDGLNSCCKGKRCANIRVKLSSTAMDAYRNTYEATIARMSTGITMLSKSLERIFKEDTGEKSYRSSGMVSVPRLASGKRTARVFTRRRNPKGLKDIHVCLLADESGSTRGAKIDAIRDACIGLSEVFAKLNMKTSVIGFSADESVLGLSGSYHAVHRHYINGDNTRNNRLKLLSLNARRNNFDGYSIRYAGEYLKRQKEEYKLLIVISDGEPVCNSYSYYSNTGTLDTKLAIKEASKYCKVVGVLVGGGNPEKHQEMYGYNFLHISSVKDLFDGLGAIIKKQIKDWG